MSAKPNADLNLSVDIAGGKRSLTLANPVMVASGTFSYGTDYAKIFDIQRLGAIVSKTTTLRPRAGSPAGGRIDETPAGMLNSIGLQNIGMEKPAPAPKQKKAKVTADDADADRSTANTLGDLIKEKMAGKLKLD